jgi:hypothetical protein
MFRSARARAAVCLLGAVGTVGAVSEADLTWIAGYIVGSDAVMDSAEMGLHLATIVGGAGAASSLTGIGASWGGPMMTAAAITAGMAS